MDAERAGLRAIGEHMPQLGEPGVAVLFHEPGDAVATAPAAWLALDRERRDEEVRKGVRAVSHAWGGLGLTRVVLRAIGLSGQVFGPRLQVLRP
jgi:hypothetical protein